MGQKRNQKKNKKVAGFVLCLLICGWVSGGCAQKQKESTVDTLKTLTEEKEPEEFLHADNTGQLNKTAVAYKEQENLEESPSNRYFNTLADAQKLYPGLQVKQKAGNYKLKQIQINEKDIPKKERTFSEDDILSVTLYYAYGERGFIYTWKPGEDAKTQAAAYDDRNEKQEDGTWFIYVQETSKNPYLCLQQVDDGCVFIGQGNLETDENGNCEGSFYWEESALYTKGSLLSLSKRLKKEHPLVSIS